MLLSVTLELLEERLMPPPSPNLGLISRNEIALFLDYYELTSTKTDFDHDNQAVVTQEYFVRNPPFGGYMVAAGLEQFIAYIQHLRFEEKDLGWLEATSGPDFKNGFLDFLLNFKFTGEIYAVPEGTIVFEDEPIVNVTGPAIEVQVLETYLLNVMNFQTLVATKAARMVDVAGERTVVDFGARRAHGRDAAILAARASYLAGATGTSLVLAGKVWGIPYIGTMPHAFIQNRSNELQAFREYSHSFPHNVILLVDTYDTLQGVQNATIIGKELSEQGHNLQGIRLDSGDLLTLSQQARKILDDAGLSDVKIFVSSDLDEYHIEELVRAQAPIDGFGVGTRLVTGANFNPITREGGPSALQGVYKLVERIDKDGHPIPKTKLSAEKVLVPYRKQVFRHRDKTGLFHRDTVARWNETIPETEALLIPIIKKGQLVYEFPHLDEIRAYCRSQIEQLPASYRILTDPPIYPVKLSPELEKAFESITKKS
ncbi:MAG: nicotinate phosphoribosyltransferase [Candidatus Hodarchaeota archaeon]